MEVKDLYAAFRQKAGFEVVGETITDTQLRVIGRVPNASVSTWLRVLEQLLLYEGQSSWSIDISKQYFLGDGSIRYGWRIILQSKDNVVNHIQNIVGIVHSVQGLQRQLMEVALHASPNRNALKRGKGAQSTIGAVVGPMAIANANQGR